MYIFLYLYIRYTDDAYNMLSLKQIIVKKKLLLFYFMSILYSDWSNA